MPQAPPMLLLCGVLSIVYVRVQRLFKTTATALKRIEGIFFICLYSCFKEPGIHSLQPDY